MVLVSLLANVILSPDLEIVRPVPASKTISSTLLPLPPAVNLIFSSSALSPSKQEIEYVVFVLVSDGTTHDPSALRYLVVPPPDEGTKPAAEEVKLL